MNKDRQQTNGECAIFLNINEEEVKGKHYRPAAHALVYCKIGSRMPSKYEIMMQMRFDGTLGFPGGYVEFKENLEVGLNRELHEEIGLPKYLYFKEDDYFGSWYHDHLHLLDHFYAKEISENDFVKLEKGTLNCKDWGGETMGIIRVPLDEKNNFKALAQFLKNNFIGNAKYQLLKVIIDKKILKHGDIEIATATA